LLKQAPSGNRSLLAQSCPKRQYRFAVALTSLAMFSVLLVGTPLPLVSAIALKKLDIRPVIKT
jgi:hypothetical protein